MNIDTMCSLCLGSGIIRYTVGGLGVCPNCTGDGRKRKPCPACKGNGAVIVDEPPSLFARILGRRESQRVARSCSACKGTRYGTELVGASDDLGFDVDDSVLPPWKAGP